MVKNLRLIIINDKERKNGIQIDEFQGLLDELKGWKLVQEN